MSTLDYINVTVVDKHNPLHKLLETPKYRISKDCPMTDECRAMMDAWCDEFFGTKHHALLFDPKKIFGLSIRGSKLK